MCDDPKRYENDGLYEDEDTEYEDEYEADDSDYIVDDEDEEDENALWDDAEEDSADKAIPMNLPKRSEGSERSPSLPTAIPMQTKRKPRNTKRHGADLQRNSVSLMK